MKKNPNKTVVSNTTKLLAIFMPKHIHITFCTLNNIYNSGS